MLLRFADDIFNQNPLSTIGVDFKIKTLKVDQKFIKMQVWDTAGQECFRSITKIFYRGAHVVILAYSLISGLSFENLTDWLKEVR